MKYKIHQNLNTMKINFLKISKVDLQLTIILLAAFSVSLPMAWISLSKILLLFSGLFFLLSKKFNPNELIKDSLTIKIILLVIFTFLISIFWTKTNLYASIEVWLKHSKIIVIPIIILLTKNYKNARLGLVYFLYGQLIVLFLSYALSLGISLPWKASDDNSNVVFSTSYIDQGIMLGTTSALFWHLHKKSLLPFNLSKFFAPLCIFSTLFLLNGRTGYIVASAMLVLTFFWMTSNRLRWTILTLMPIFIGIVFYFGSVNIKNRLIEVATESSSFFNSNNVSTSSGWRLNAWLRSVEAIQEKPWYGYGVGGWTSAVKEIQGPNANMIFGEGDGKNPHQEYLLWGVELGIFGIFLYLIFLYSILKESRKFQSETKYALWLVVISLAISTLFNSTLYDDMIGDYYCILIGLLLALGKHELHFATQKVTQ
jgi:O-antigen ligase